MKAIELERIQKGFAAQVMHLRPFMEKDHLDNAEAEVLINGDANSIAQLVKDIGDKAKLDLSEKAIKELNMAHGRYMATQSCCGSGCGC